MKTRSFTYVHGHSAISIVVSSKVTTPTGDGDPQHDGPRDRDGIFRRRLGGRRNHRLDQLLDVDADVPRDQELEEPEPLRLPPCTGEYAETAP